MVSLYVRFNDWAAQTRLGRFVGKTKLRAYGTLISIVVLGILDVVVESNWTLAALTIFLVSLFLLSYRRSMVISRP